MTPALTIAYFLLFVLFAVTPPMLVWHGGIYRPWRNWQNQIQATRWWQRQEKRRQLQAQEAKLLRERHIAAWNIATGVARDISEEYHQMKISYVPASWERGGRRNKGRPRIQKVTAKDIIIGADYFVLSLSLPRGVYSTTLEEPDKLTEIKRRLKRPCKLHIFDRDGIYMEFSLLDAYESIPEFFPYKSSQHSMTALSGLPDGNHYLPIGLGQDRKYFYINLIESPHLLVVGTTGGGKSNYLNVAISSIAERCSPDDVQLLLIDMKRVEFWLYRHLPHLWRPIVVEYGEVTEALSALREEVDRRYHLLATRDVRNTTAWNNSYPEEKMPRIIVVFDEMADVMLDRKHGGDIAAILERMSALSRAVDIHLILCTQRPEVKVITGLIQANFTARLVLAVSSGINSRMVLDNEDATKLKVPGRAIYQNRGYNEEVQTARILDKQISNAIRKAAAKRPLITGGKLLSMMVDKKPTTIKDVWQLVDGQPGATRPWVEKMMQHWQYIPATQSPMLRHGHDHFICWFGRLHRVKLDQLPRSTEELFIQMELETEVI